jgi:ribonuclease BN (tRNA processing enzyme)
MRVLILGVGDAFTRRHFGSSALIEAPEGYVLIDCPDPIHRVLAEATARAGWKVEATDINDVILTHLHGDHCNGLESFAFTHRITAADSNPPRLHASPPTAARLWERLAPAMDGSGFDGRPTRTLETYFDLHVMDPDQPPARIAGLTVRCRYTKHPVPTVGLLVSDGTTTLGWSSDTPYEQAHINWLSEADLIVHECNRGDPHTPIDALNALPDDVRTRIRLIHLPDDFDGSSTDMRRLDEGDVL